MQVDLMSYESINAILALLLITILCLGLSLTAAGVAQNRLTLLDSTTAMMSGQNVTPATTKMGQAASTSAMQI